MTTEVDPSSQVRILTQALAHRDSRLGFLLGAGCGSSIKDSAGKPLIPAIDALTTIVCDAIGKSAVSDSLKVLQKQYSDDAESCPNIEKLLSRIRSLHEIVGKGKVRGLSSTDLDKLDEGICREIEHVVERDLPDGVTSYSAFARWIREIDRRQPVEIFTTNYDLLIEEALERVRAPFFDGFVGAHEPFFDISAMELDRLPERWTRLWKIHGSINWRLDAGGGIVRSRDGKTKPLIFPSHLKYAESRRLPYLAMRDRLRDFVKGRGIFITCGYSFADEHINEDILSGLAANAGSVCYALMYLPIAENPVAQKLALQRPNLNVMARDGGVLRGREVAWPKGQAFDLGNFEGFGNFVMNEVMGEASTPST